MKPWEKYSEPQGPWVNYQSESKAVDAPHPVKDIEQKRKELSEGATLQLGPLDTGVEIPQWLNEALSGAGMRLSQAFTLGTHKPDEQVKEALGSPAGVAGQVVGDMAALAAGGTALKAGAAIPKVGGALNAAGSALTAPKTLKQAAGAGAAYGSATSDDRVSGGLSGLAGGSIGYAVPAAAGSVVKPQLQKGADLLKKKGVDMTPGELLGGWVQRVEDGATAIPFVGDFIKSAKGRSLQSFNKALINDSLEVVGERLDDSIPAGREAIARANDVLSAKYDELLPKANVQLDGDFIKDLSVLNGMVRKLPEREQKLFSKHLNDEVFNNFGNENFTALGETFKMVDSSLRKKYKSLLRSGDTYQKELGMALREVHNAMIGMAKRQNPQWAEELSKVDKAYAMMSRINDAASFTGAKEGIFTPAHLVNSVKKAAASKKAYASGRAYGQELAESAKGILPATVPDSGTATRAMIGAGALGGAAYIDPMALAAMGIGSAAYTRPGVNAIAAGIANRPGVATPISNSLRKLAPYGGALGVPVGISVPE